MLLKTVYDTFLAKVNFDITYQVLVDYFLKYKLIQASKVFKKKIEDFEERGNWNTTGLLKNTIISDITEE